MVRRQAELLDRAHRRAEAEERRRTEERRAPPQNRLPNSPLMQRHQQDREADRAEAERDAARQRALRRALGEVMQQFGDLTGEIPEPLGRADQAMRDSQERLGEGRDARDPQGRAIRELTEGSRQMAQAMRRQMGDEPGEPGEEEGEGEGMAEGGENGGEGQDRMQAQGQGRDPLGRRTREQAGGADTGADVRVPEEAERLRSRELQQEIRRRAAERDRPRPELEYLERLLPRF